MWQPAPPWSGPHTLTGFTRHWWTRPCRKTGPPWPGWKNKPRPMWTAAPPSRWSGAGAKPLCPPTTPPTACPNFAKTRSASSPWPCPTGRCATCGRPSRPRPCSTASAAPWPASPTWAVPTHWPCWPWHPASPPAAGRCSPPGGWPCGCPSAGGCASWTLLLPPGNAAARPPRCATAQPFSATSAAPGAAWW